MAAGNVCAPDSSILQGGADKATDRQFLRREDSAQQKRLHIAHDEGQFNTWLPTNDVRLILAGPRPSEAAVPHP